MAKKKQQNLKPKKNPLSVVLYIIIVAALLAAICLLVVQSKKRTKEYADEIAKLAVSETEYVQGLSEEETQESEEMQTNVETKEMESDTNAGKEASILLLNGTEKSGVAAYWRKKLEEAGFTNLNTASYSKLSGEKTIVYTDDEVCEKELKIVFPEAEFQKGEAEGSFEMAGGEAKPETIDAYVVIGTRDTESME